MGSGTVLRVFTHKHRGNPYFVDFLKFFGPERPVKARSIPGGTWLLIAVMGPVQLRLPVPGRARNVGRRRAVSFPECRCCGGCAVNSILWIKKEVAQKEEGKGPPHIRRGRLTEFQGEDDGQPFKHRPRHLPWVKGREFPYGCQGAVSLSPIFASG
jgi:hypothetical protein